MKVCFVASGPITWASARIRAYWVAEQMENATVSHFEDTEFPLADVYIFQKSFNFTLAQVARKDGRKVWWDVCDPMWWFSPNETREILTHVDGVVCSTQGLADDFNQGIGREMGITAYVIPDRINPAHFPIKREHRDTDPVRFIWFGMAQNRVALAGAWANLHRLVSIGHNIELTVFDNRPGVELGYGKEFPIYYKKWRLEEENAVVAAHDVALLPPYPGPWGAVKSDNKAQTAHACGLPVATGHSYDFMVEMMNANKRGYAIPPTMENVSQSATEWETLLCSA